MDHDDTGPQPNDHLEGAITEALRSSPFERIPSHVLQWWTVALEVRNAKPMRPALHLMIVLIASAALAGTRFLPRIAGALMPEIDPTVLTTLLSALGALSIVAVADSLNASRRSRV